MGYNIEKNEYPIIQTFTTEGSMEQEEKQKQIDPRLCFHLMKIAFQDYQKSVCNLTELEYCDVYQHASEEMLLHRVILGSTEACCVVIPEVLLNQTLNDVISEYPSSGFFDKILQENNMNLVDYTSALHSDLRVETVLARIASSVEAVTTAEMEHSFSAYRAQLKHAESIDHDQSRGVDMSALLSKTEKALCKIIDKHCCSQATPPSNSSQKTHCCKSDSFLSDRFCHELNRVLASLSAETISISKASSTIYSMLLKKNDLIPAVPGCRLSYKHLSRSHPNVYFYSPRPSPPPYT